ncbi:MAG: YfiR family protein [bacterium]|nr:YfiR family protein [bacterium]
MAVLAVVLTATVVGQPQQPRMEEYDLKAIFISNFLKYVEWPEEAFEDAESPLVVGIQGSDPFGPRLDELVTRLQPIIGRRVVTAAYEPGEPVAEFHVLFVPESERKEVKRMLGGACGQPILTVGEQRGFAEDGGVINFVTDRNRIRFEINLRCAEAGGLELSAQLLKLARRVYDADDERGP